MTPSRPASATPVSTRCSAHVATSRIAAKRPAPLSALTNERPNPDDPRTLAAYTAIPAASSVW